MLLLILLALEVRAADPPFWRARKDLYERIETAEVIVAANSKPTDADHRRLTIRGGGRVRTPAQFAYDFARDFDRVARLSGYVEKSEYENDELNVTFKALGQRADLKIRVKRDDPARTVGFVVVNGPVAGLSARLNFEDVGPNRADVGIDGEYIYANKVKNTILGVGLEGVFKLMAGRLRDAVEREWRSVDKARTPVKGSGA